MPKLTTTCLIFLLSGLSPLAMAAVPVNGTSNILLIIADDLGVDNISVYNEHNNSPSTPTIDDLAAQGVLFRNAWTNSVCAPSRAAIMTGRHGFRNGVTHVAGDYSDLPTSEETIAEVLSAAGYATAAFGKWGLGTDANANEYPTDQGFDYFSGNLDDTLGTGNTYTSWPKLTISGATTLFDGTETEYATKVTATEAATWIKAQGNNQWFASVAFHAPHSPFHVPPDDGANDTYDKSTWTMGPNSNCGIATVPGTSLEYREMCYRAAVEAMDYYIEYLLAEIATTNNALENTLIIFIGDNGTPNTVIINETDSTPFDNTHGKGTQYEGGVNVPLIISGGTNMDVDSSEVADMILGADIFSTIMEVADAPRTSTAALDSTSLVSYLDETSDPSARTVNYSELYREQNSNISIDDWSMTNSAVKYLTYLDDNGDRVEECYALTIDPGETNNLWGNNSAESDICIRLKSNRPSGDDTDGDGLFDNFELIIGTDPNDADSDGDTLTDGFEVGYDGNPTDYDSTTDLNPLAVDTDGDGFNDNVEINNNSSPIDDNSVPTNQDGDLAPHGAPDGNLNAADYLVGTRIVLGQITATNIDLSHGDLYPPGAPDGIINISDLLLLNQLIMNPPLDITDAIFVKTTANCADYVRTYTSSVMDINRSLTFDGNLVISINGDKCIFSGNGIPNHDFNDGTNSFPNDVSEQSRNFEITTNPQISGSITDIVLSTDNAIFLNSVKLDLLAAACFGVGDEKIGCNDMAQPWRFDPMSPLNTFNTDSHNAHTQPDGAYHYHGSPVAMFQSDVAVVSPVIGFAADGFPIRGTYFDDGGTIRKATSSFQLKAGARVAIDGINPGGNYDGTYRDDYEYVVSSGDLDECNGMIVDGVYGYYVSESFPWVLNCFKGTVDSSFDK